MYKKNLRECVVARNASPQAAMTAMMELTRANIQPQLLLGGRAGLFALTGTQLDVPRFGLPFFISREDKFNSNKEMDYVIVDNRGIKPDDAYRYKLMAEMIMTWESMVSLEDFSLVSNLPVIAYATWVMRSLSAHNISLGVHEADRIQIAAATFYLLQTRPHTELFSPNRYPATVARIRSATDVTSDTVVQEFLETLDIPDEFTAPSIYTLIEWIQGISPALKVQVDYSTLMGRLGSSMGYGRDAILGNLAAEYPPVFIAFMYLGLTDRSFKRSKFGDQLKNFAVKKARGLEDTFLKAMENIIANVETTTDFKR